MTSLRDQLKSRLLVFRLERRKSNEFAPHTAGWPVRQKTGTRSRQSGSKTPAICRIYGLRRGPGENEQEERKRRKVVRWVADARLKRGVCESQAEQNDRGNTFLLHRRQLITVPKAPAHSKPSPPLLSPISSPSHFLCHLPFQLQSAIHIP